MTTPPNGSPLWSEDARVKEARDAYDVAVSHYDCDVMDCREDAQVERSAAKVAAAFLALGEAIREAGGGEKETRGFGAPITKEEYAVRHKELHDAQDAYYHAVAGSSEERDAWDRFLAASDGFCYPPNLIPTPDTPAEETK